MPNYLEKRRRRWYATLDIPKDVRAKLGHKPRFFQSLKTESHRHALQMVLPVVARWKQQIANARGGDELVAEATLFRDLLRKENDPEQRELLNNRIWERFDNIWQRGAPKGVLDADEARTTSTTLDRAERFADLAWDHKLPINEHFEEWLADTNVAEKTLRDHRRALKQLLNYHSMVQDITKRAASDFTRKVLSPGLKTATVNRRLSTYHKYWNWLEARGYLSDEYRNPWEGQSLSPKDGEEQKRRAFTEKEGAALLASFHARANKYPDDLALTRLMAVTGLRVEEAASIRGRNLELADGAVWVSIPKGKTPAAKRTIPVVEPIVKADLQGRASIDGFIFENLGSLVSENGRANAYKKRAGRLLDIINDDPELVANHSWRYRAVSLLELGGTERHIADYFVGHAQKGESLKRYHTDGNSKKLLVAARLLSLPVDTVL